MFTIADQPEQAELSRDAAAGLRRDAVIGPLRRGRAALAAGAAAGCALAVALALSGTPRFVATAEVLLDHRPVAAQDGATLQAADAMVETEVALAGSSAVLQRVVERARLAGDPQFGATAGEALAHLRASLTVERGADGLVDISLENGDADKAARLANFTAEAFVDELARGRSETARRASEALSARLADLQRKAVVAEERVAAYRDAITPEHTGALAADDAGALSGRLARIRGDIAELRARAGSFERMSVDDVLRGAVPSVPGSEALARLGETYSDLARQATLLATQLGPRHPRRIAGDEAVVNAREVVARELSRIGAATGAELAEAQASERDLARRIDELRAKQAATGGEAATLRELQRDADSSRAVYEAFLMRAKGPGEDAGSAVAGARVVSEATVPQAPVTSWLTAALAGLAGLLFGAALVAAFLAARRFAPRSRAVEGAVTIPMDAPEAADNEAVAEMPALRESVAADREAFAPQVPPVSTAESERQSLREQVRALADRTPADAPPLEGDGARLLREIDEVREAIAALYGDRSRRRAA